MLLPTYHPYLEIKKSLITGANLGLFALCDIPPNVFIDVYHGTVYTDSELHKWERENPDQNAREYLLFDSENHFNIVPWKSDDCYARFANDVSLQGRFCNAEFCNFEYKKDLANLKHFKQFEDQREHLPSLFKEATMCIKSTCHIQNQDEIYVSYGNSYWIDEKAKLLKQQLNPKKRKFQRIVRVIKQKLANKSAYYKKKNKRGNIPIDLQVPVWPAELPNQKAPEAPEAPEPAPAERGLTPSESEGKEFIMAQWSSTTENALPCRNSGILDYDPSKNKWLILKNTPETLSHPCARFVSNTCILPGL